MSLLKQEPFDMISFYFNANEGVIIVIMWIFYGLGRYGSIYVRYKALD